MNIQFVQLSEIHKSELIELMNNQLVQRQMPLANKTFSAIDCDDFVAAKEQLWAEHGYGPSAFIVDGEFAGWGGLQPENGEADLALVLHPSHWGVGKKIYTEIVRRAFDDMGLNELTALLPPSRKKAKGLLRLGFKEDGALNLGGEIFIRYRLKKG